MNHDFLTHWLATTESRCQPSTPFIIIMCGLSGSGKSTVSRFLAQHYRAAWIRSDIERKRLFGLTAHQSGKRAGRDIYSKTATKQTFQRMASLAQQLLVKNYPVIFDSCALKLLERELFRSIGQRLKIPTLTLFCDAPTDTLIRRIHIRQQQEADPSEAQPCLISKQQAWLEMPTSVETHTLIRVDTECCDWREMLLEALKLSAICHSNCGEEK